MNYASRWARLLARAVDLIVFGLVVLVLGASGIVDLDNIDNPYTMDGLITGVVGLVYFGAPAAAFGATLGKMALGMRVVGHNGEKASCIAILIREVTIQWSGFFITFPLQLMLGSALGTDAARVAVLFGILTEIIIILPILVDDRRQGWHDKIAGTFVVKTK